MTAIKDARLYDDIEAIKALIQAFFDRVNNNDPQGLQHLFVPSAHLTILRQFPDLAPPQTSPWSELPQPSLTSTTSNEQKISLVYQSSIEAFIKLIEDGNKRKDPKKPVPKVHEVPDLDATDVKVDGIFATAWCPFSVTFDGVLHHYGTFVYTFGKDGHSSGGLETEKDLKLETLVQSYRRTPGWGEDHSDTSAELSRRA
ncbi:hypothetical protein CLAFUW4_04339 [Fulvia fulva]|uniref:Uncharacterized protein n=1 Tax=Passalora fulva TaxID=5499 RepID=A0A9Q8P7N3_PASFU|nr:uncharacterized protein CLAFUR5_04302 [Fulvia fulva]KAK4626958.1 hypothetical protein CLAFUR4_04325 [Fulvia fulva]KAK4628682.1 hypothetical protein CLAFUR0_04327 [Fulvia fulva]UJO16304.1 hypothetical protein CLAFUR5_04302 [Fulvia fulva]WPV14137.1 hypothetical protein CLAFUW4_04339 [Fulvia fulva]WPV28648.1 hypothetical protein CLAFUW7_04328 [Fulvia fulva]